MPTNTGINSTNNTSESGITDEDLENLLHVVMMATDLRSGAGKTNKQLEDALYTKLSFSPIAGMSDFFEQETTEVREQLTASITSHLSADEVDIVEGRVPGDRKILIEKARTAINADPSKKKVVDLLLEAARSLKKCIEFYEENSGDGDLEEFGALLLEAVSDIAKVRVFHDVIPLLQRGLYATEVRQALEFWKNNSDDPKVNGKEGAWQKELTDRIAVLQRALGGKAVLLNDQAHVGSEGFDGKGDRITDFLFQHSDTRNIFLVEIKTPETPLIGIHYRNTYALSEELSGTISQVLLQRHEAMTNYYMKYKKSKVEFNVAAPRCIVIAGRLDKEINNDEFKLAAFEMQRQAVESNVRIITFDELYKDFSSFHLIDD